LSLLVEGESFAFNSRRFAMERHLLVRVHVGKAISASVDYSWQNIVAHQGRYPSLLFVRRVPIHI